MNNLGQKLISLVYELLPVNNNRDLNLKYQVLVNMKCHDYYTKRMGQQLFMNCYYGKTYQQYKSMICFFACDYEADLYHLAAVGDLKALQYLYYQYGIPVNRAELAYYAAINGHIHILIWLELIGVNFREFGPGINGAAECGHLHILQWLHYHRYQGWSFKTMNLAASVGNLDIVKWLHMHRPEGCTSAAMNEAAAGGFMELVIWLHENRFEGCTSAAMDRAAKSGHLEMVYWLHYNRKEGCTSMALDNAVYHNHFEVVKFLLQNRFEGCATNAFFNAIEYGHRDISKILYEHTSVSDFGRSYSLYIARNNKQMIHHLETLFDDTVLYSAQ